MFLSLLQVKKVRKDKNEDTYVSTYFVLRYNMTKKKGFGKNWPVRSNQEWNIYLHTHSFFSILRLEALKAN